MLPKKVMRIRPCNTFMHIIRQNLVDIIGDVSRIFSIFVTEWKIIERIRGLLLLSCFLFAKTIVLELSY